LDAQCTVRPVATDNFAVHSAAPNIANAPTAIIAMLSTAIRPIVIIAKAPSPRNKGRTPHLRHAGDRKNASGIPASITIAYARNHRDPGTLIPRGASNKTRQAGHFGMTAKISEENDDDTSGRAEKRGTTTPDPTPNRRLLH
jgi:hypothetical protein